MLLLCGNQPSVSYGEGFQGSGNFETGVPIFAGFGFNCIVVDFFSEHLINDIFFAIGKSGPGLPVGQKRSVAQFCPQQ